MYLLLKLMEIEYVWVLIWIDRYLFGFFLVGGIIGGGSGNLGIFIIGGSGLGLNFVIGRGGGGGSLGVFLVLILLGLGGC